MSLSTRFLKELGLEVGPDSIARKIAVKPKVPALPAKRKAAVRLASSREPNKTEALFGQRLHCLFDSTHTIRYEAFSFRLANGSLYTADWTVWKGNALLYAYECKGSHSFQSHGRSVLAFKQAALEWPETKFTWAQWKGGEWRMAGAEEPAENLI